MAVTTSSRLASSVMAFSVLGVLVACSDPDSGSVTDEGAEPAQEEQQAPPDVEIDLEQPMLTVDAPDDSPTRNMYFNEELVVKVPVNLELGPIEVHDPLTGEQLLDYTPEFVDEEFGCNNYVGTVIREDGTAVLMMKQNARRFYEPTNLIAFDARTGDALWETELNDCHSMNLSGVVGSKAVFWGEGSMVVDLDSGDVDYLEESNYWTFEDKLYRSEDESGTRTVTASDIHGETLWEQEYQGVPDHQGMDIQNGMFSIQAETVEGTETVLSTLMINADDGSIAATLPGAEDTSCVFDGQAVFVCSGFGDSSSGAPTVTGYPKEGGDPLWEGLADVSTSSPGAGELSVRATTAPGCLTVSSRFSDVDLGEGWAAIIDSETGQIVAPQLEKPLAYAGSTYIALAIDEDTYATYAVTWP